MEGFLPLLSTCGGAFGSPRCREQPGLSKGGQHSVAGSGPRLSTMCCYKRAAWASSRTSLPAIVIPAALEFHPNEFDPFAKQPVHASPVRVFLCEEKTEAGGRGWKESGLLHHCQSDTSVLLCTQLLVWRDSFEEQRLPIRWGADPCTWGALHQQ